MVVCILAWIFDAMWGEVQRFHPLVGLGNVASGLEARYGVSRAGTSARLRLRGLGCVVLLVLGGVATALLLRWVFRLFLPAVAEPLLDALLVYFCLGHRSLKEHGRAIAVPLLAGDLPAARKALSMIVSRDTGSLDPEAIAKGVVESLLENGSDAVVASLFWYAIAGVPGVIAHRVINTLDAMWGYRSERYLYFGWAAARLDDLVNWVPARLCALGYALAGNTRLALKAWVGQARRHKSPNAGAVMAAGAGALGVVVGGPACYRGTWEARPELGIGRAVLPEDIEAALRLLNRALLILGLGWLGLRYLAG